MKYPYFIEIWLRDSAKDFIRSLSDKDAEEKHPHITLVRPFFTDNLREVQKKLVNYCEVFDPIPFYLEGFGTFKNEETVHYIHVKSKKLLGFNNGLEKVISPFVNFDTNLNPGGEKILHAKIYSKKEFESIPKMNQYMLWVTLLKNNNIIFSYDFVNKRILSRDESLNKELWNETRKKFNENQDNYYFSRTFKTH